MVATKTHKLGIDFGTSNTTMAILETQGVTKLYALEHRDIDGYEDVMASRMVVKSNGEIEAGYLAEPTSDAIFIDDLKSRLRDDTEEDQEDLKMTKQEMINRFFEVLKQKEEAFLASSFGFLNGTQVKGCVMGVPVGTSRKYKEYLENAALHVGFATTREEIEFYPESNAAIFYYLPKIEKSKKVLLYDHGGGTLDISIVQMNDINVAADILGKAGADVGGKYIDQALFKYIFTEKLPSYRLDELIAYTGMVHQNIDDEDFFKELNQTILGGRIMTQIEEMKIRFSRSEKNQIWYERDPENSSSEEARFELKVEDFTYQEFEKSIADVLAQAAATIDEALSQAGLNESDIDYVLLVGGSAKNKPIQSMLEHKFGKQKVHKNQAEMMSVVGRGLATAGGLIAPKVEDIVEFNYGIWDGIENKVYTIISKGTKIKETKINKMRKRGIYETFRLPDGNGRRMELIIFEDDQEVGVVRLESPTPLTEQFDIFFEINPKKGVLNVEVFDRASKKWLETEYGYSKEISITQSV